MSRSYWKERERQKQARMDKVTDEQIERFRELLLASLDDLDKQIQKIYMKYAKDNNLDYHDALQYLTDDEKKEFQKDLQYYLEKAQNEQDRIQYKQELHALSVRHRVKRIEMLKANIQKHASILHDQLNTKTRKAISSLYPEGFLRGVYESVQGDDPDGVPLAEAINPSYVQEILETPWSGKNYSEKIWDLTADFEKKLSETLTQGLVQGKHPNEMARDFRKLGVGKEGTGGIVHRAETLMQTESAYIIEQATLKGYAATKIDEYEFMTAKDGKVCGICADINKERFPCGKAITGTNYPPMHPRCRCTTVPVTPYSNEDTNEQYVYETDYDEWYDTYCADAVDDAYAQWAKENGVNLEEDVFEYDEGTSKHYRRMELSEEEYNFTRIGNNKQTITVKAKKVNRSGVELYISTNVSSSIKPKKLHDLPKELKKLVDTFGFYEPIQLPKIILGKRGVDFSKNACGVYNVELNAIFIDDTLFSSGSTQKDIELALGGGVCETNYLSGLVHEMFHWKDAEEFRRKSGIQEIKSNSEEYMEYWNYCEQKARRNIQKTEEIIEKSTGKEYHISDISDYARLHFTFQPDETWTEYRTKCYMEGIEYEDDFS